MGGITTSDCCSHTGYTSNELLGEDIRWKVRTHNIWSRRVILAHTHVRARLRVRSGECAKCQYFPTVPVNETGLPKACLNDNTGDPSAANPFFYKSTLQMARRWNGRVETHYSDGGHCQISSFWDIVHCLDDGTSRLIDSQAPPTPGPPSPPSPPGPPGACVVRRVASS